MPEWFWHSFNAGQPLVLSELVYHLLTAFVLGAAVAGIHWATRRRDVPPTASLLATLVLLSILIAMLTKVIGDNAARAFSLAGVLAIVRFRTVVEDSRDTAFVIFAVIVGMAVGANYIAVALVGIVVAGLAAAVVRPWNDGGNDRDWHLTVRVGIGDDRGPLEAALARYVLSLRPLAAATGRQGAALDLTYRIRLLPETTPTALVADLNRVVGVQQVELRRPVE
ncbi:MAG: DUF4956 domain-containing protein [Gemmataceae bacterium]|nr:DUF4956 domain-containing protein [Gemmataceae bacterium]